VSSLLLRVGMMRASNDMVVVLVMTYGSLMQMLWMGVNGHTYVHSFDTQFLVW
jgi:hypothetical protein